MTLGSHQRTVGETQSWITPRWIIDAVGPFDLDPCAAELRPWNCAVCNYTEAQNGLDQQWFGRVWLNPPFDRYEVGQWIEKLAAHGDGIALLHVRTEADWFEPVWNSASAILFLADRIYFHYPNGDRASANSGAPACLVAFGHRNHMVLRDSKIHGYITKRWAHIK